MAESTYKQKTIDVSRRNEEEEGARLPSVRLERMGDQRVRSGSRQESGDRDRSPIRGDVDGGASLVDPVPSTSATSTVGAGEAEATRTIRTRSGGVYTPAPPSDEEDHGADSDASVESVRSARSGCSTSSTKRKKGRPPTTGEYVGLAEAKKKFVEACEAEERVRAVEAILDPTIPVRQPSRGSKPLPDEAAMARDYRQRPTADVAAAVLESQQEVERVASVSKGLQGGFVRALRIAALNTRTAVMELATRSSTATTKRLEEDNHRLQQQVAELTAEVARLRQAFEGGQKLMPPPPPPLPPTEQEPLESMQPPTKRPKPSPRPTPQQREAEACSVSQYSNIDTRANDQPLSMEERIYQRLCRFLDAKMESYGNKKEEPSIQNKGLTGGRTSMRVPTGGVSTPGTSPRGISTQMIASGGSSKATNSRTTVSKNKDVQKKRGAAAPSMDNGAAHTKMGSLPSGVSPAVATKDTRPQEEWAKVVGRKEKRQEKAAASSMSKKNLSAKAAQKGGKAKPATAGSNKRALPARPPRTAAVTVTVPAGAKATLAEVLVTATTKINLAEVGIAKIRPKPAVNGGLILEVPGQDGAAKADALAAKMSEVLQGTGARVARPTKKAELRVRGLVPSVTPGDVAATIATVGGCRAEDVQTGEIRNASSGLGTLWVRCPVAAARKVAVQRKIVIGWMEVTVETLQARPLQCFKCLEVGHTREKCPSETDRSGRCYNCGDPSHKASACRASPKCPVCADQGKPAGHRLGGRACAARAGSKKSKKGGEKKSGTKAAAPPSTAVGQQPAALVEKETVAEQPLTAGPAGPDGEKMITE